MPNHFRLLLRTWRSTLMWKSTRLSKKGTGNVLTPHCFNISQLTIANNLIDFNYDRNRVAITDRFQLRSESREGIQVGLLIQPHPCKYESTERRHLT